MKPAVIYPLQRTGLRRNLTVNARLMKTGAILQRTIVPGKRQHRDKVELVIVLSDVLQYLHHRRRRDKVVPGQA